jgi:hypothetical protein
MRRVLVDQARSEHRQNRSGGASVPLTDALAWTDPTPEATIDLDRVLEELAVLDPRRSCMVDLRFFLGFSAKETAELLQISKVTIAQCGGDFSRSDAREQYILASLLHENITRMLDAGVSESGQPTR